MATSKVGAGKPTDVSAVEASEEAKPRELEAQAEGDASAPAKREKAVGGSTAFRGGFAADDLQKKFDELQAKEPRKLETLEREGGAGKAGPTAKADEKVLAAPKGKKGLEKAPAAPDPDLAGKVRYMATHAGQIFRKQDPDVDVGKALGFLNDAAKAPAGSAAREELNQFLKGLTPEDQKAFRDTLAKGAAPELKARVEAEDKAEAASGRLTASGPGDMTNPTLVRERAVKDPKGLAGDMARLAASDDPKHHALLQQIGTAIKDASRFRAESGASAATLTQWQPFFETVSKASAPGTDRLKAAIAPAVAQQMEGVAEQQDKFSKEGTHGVFGGVGKQLATIAKDIMKPPSAALAIQSDPKGKDAVPALTSGILRFDPKGGDAVGKLVGAVAKEAAAQAKARPEDADALKKQAQGFADGVKGGVKRQLEHDKALVKEGREITQWTYDMVKTVMGDLSAADKEGISDAEKAIEKGKDFVKDKIKDVAKEKGREALGLPPEEKEPEEKTIEDKVFDFFEEREVKDFQKAADAMSKGIDQTIADAFK